MKIASCTFTLGISHVVSQQDNKQCLIPKTDDPTGLPISFHPTQPISCPLPNSFSFAGSGWVERHVKLIASAVWELHEYPQSQRRSTHRNAEQAVAVKRWWQCLCQPISGEFVEVVSILRSSSLPVSRGARFPVRIGQESELKKRRGTVKDSNHGNLKRPPHVFL